MLLGLRTPSGVQCFTRINLYVLLHYAGVASSDYGSLLARYTETSAFHATATAISVASGRVSYSFGMRGPSMSIETACSASLVALHLALRSVRSVETPLSLAAGVHVQCAHFSSGYVAAAGMFSPVGRCQVLDSAADGYVRGETCVAVGVAEPSSVLNNTGGTAMAVLRGSAVNQDGRSSSLTAPNGPAQQELLRAALQDAGADPAVIQGCSMHGTGTSLGDPIEVGAAWAVLGCGRKHTVLDFVASKSWVGHGEPAAGLAGFLFAHHMVSAHAALPILHLRMLNPYVGDALKQSLGSVRLPRQLAAAAEGVNAMVGVSAFAFQGTNAHVVVQKQIVNQSRAGSMKVEPRWSRQRFYIVPPAHLLVHQAVFSVKAASGPLIVAFQADLSIPQLAYLWDHRVSEREIFPGNGLGYSSLHHETQII